MGQKILNKLRTREFWFNNAIYVLFVVYFIVFSFLTPKFLTFSNIVSAFKSGSSMLLVSAGMTVVMIGGGIDVSVGSNLYMCATILFMLGKINTPIPVMILVAVLTGAAGGALNGVLVASFDIHPMLPTLAMSFVFRGIGLQLTGGGISPLPDYWMRITTWNIAGIPIFIFVGIAIAILIQLFLTRTVFGRRIFALGDSEKTAKEKGIPVFAYKVLIYAICGLMGGVASIVVSSQTMVAGVTIGQTTHTYAILAAVLGGASMYGAKGTAFPGSVIGALILAFLSNAMVLMNASPYLYTIVYAIVIIVVILLDTLKNKERH